MCIYVSQNLYRMKRGHWEIQSKQQKYYEMNKEIQINIEKNIENGRFPKSFW